MHHGNLHVALISSSDAVVESRLLIKLLLMPRDKQSIFRCQNALGQSGTKPMIPIHGTLQGMHFSCIVLIGPIARFTLLAHSGVFYILRGSWTRTAQV